MAFFPCSRGHVNKKGRNRNVYMAYGSGTDFTRWSLRFCDGHFAEVDEYLAQFEVLPMDETVGINGTHDTCLACLKPAAEVDWQVFVTSYPPNDERKDYWAKLHVGCRVPMILADPGKGFGSLGKTF